MTDTPPPTGPGPARPRSPLGSGPGGVGRVARPTSEDVEAVAEGIRGLWDSAVSAP
ncbi:hypothetical protein OK074_9033, partial [Actinobacteria bacterium OK074]